MGEYFFALNPKVFIAVKHDDEGIPRLRILVELEEIGRGVQPLYPVKAQLEGWRVLQVFGDACKCELNRPSSSRRSVVSSLGYSFTSNP